MNNYQKAKKKVECAKENNFNFNCYVPITGPTGPQGPATINVGQTLTLDSQKDAMVRNIGTDENVILEFSIPRGPIGNDGESDLIVVRSTTTGAEGTKAMVKDEKNDHVHYLDFVIPKGDTGAPGPKGPNLVESAYIVTFDENYPKEGYEVKELGKLPLTRKEMDSGNVCTVNNDNTIKFSKIGFYKITFNVSAYVEYLSDSFNFNSDFVSIGFRVSNSKNIYIGKSMWITDEVSHCLVAEGIITVNNTNDLYELVNLSKRSIFLKTPDIVDINSNSYFVNAPVTMIIEYLGR